MIIGIGIDIVNIDRIKALCERFGNRFANKCFTAEERHFAQERRNVQFRYYSALAVRFAAKEAAAKALGTGFRGGTTFQDFQITNDDKGKPILKITGQAHQRMEEILPPGTVPVIHLTMTDEPPLAQAMVIIEARQDTGPTPVSESI